jgi:hypothetical protein
MKKIYLSDLIKKLELEQSSQDDISYAVGYYCYSNNYLFISINKGANIKRELESVEKEGYAGAVIEIL